jgi:hypothetical protein
MPELGEAAIAGNPLLADGTAYRRSTYRRFTYRTSATNTSLSRSLRTK